MSEPRDVQDERRTIDVIFSGVTQDKAIKQVIAIMSSLTEGLFNKANANQD
jgi:hypothetical protein